ncbi:conserved phage C-terminal domain-containing protein [Paenibacillus bouchesdurhonensis]|uniref:conserved phage C-terminal domain-containing protein n=1 Tax=Paenibacillus bouchesdurhonensis TaxID=1870990 RepID=UPI000DA6035E|nr:conserved phage C-terminal domain-containing protein [Paenibacillus bouchesdurhonensis]
MSGFIPIGRELQNHWIRRDKDYWNVFCEMYFLARFSTKPETRVVDGLEVIINHKEFIFGRPGWSRRLDISEQRLKTLIKKLVDEGFIKLTQRHSKFTVYSFEYAPEINQQNNQHSNQQEILIQPTEPLEPQGFEVDSNQQDFSEQPAQQPAQQPMKEEGIKEEGLKEEGVINMPSIEHQQIASELISYLNKKTGKRYRATKGTTKLIIARLNEGYSKDDCIHVIDVKCAEWIGTAQEKYLDYETLFRPSKFPKYLEQRLDIVTRDSGHKTRTQRNQEEMEILNQFYEEGAARETNGNSELPSHDQDRLPLL